MLNKTKCLGLVILFLTLLFAGLPNVRATETCDNTTTACETMCANVYDTCSMSFKNSDNEEMTKAECITACGSTDPDVVTCLTDIECDMESIASCLVNATASSGSGSSEDNAGSYIGGGGVTDGEGTTNNGGGCGEISDCNSCITNCRCRWGGTAAVSTCCTGCGCECELFCMPTDWWIATCM